MGLNRFLLRVAADHPHVLLIEVPGGTRVRLIAERELRQRSWAAATSPADTDVLVITGPLGQRLQPRVDRVWQQIPGPRVYLHLPEPDLESSTVATALDHARTKLAAGGEPIPPASSQDPDTAHGSGQRHAPADHHDMHGGHGDMHAGRQDMEMPGGLPMADRGEDRDGLMLDQLHIPLGPLLPDWPAGLVVHTTLQGDVVQAARIEVLRADGALDDFWGAPWRRAAAGEPVTVGETARRCVAARLDSLARLLAVVGWPDAAARTRWLRDDVLCGTHAEQLLPRARRLARRLRGSRTLRWLTDGVGVLPGGDASARWLTWLADIEQALTNLAITDPISGVREPPRGPDALLAALPGLLAGTEFATARLIVASLDPGITGLGATAVVTGG